MSYILDALKKADRDRTLGSVPDLETAHWGERRRARTRHWGWAVAALLFFNGLLVTVLLLDRGDGNTGAGQGRVVSQTGERPGPATPAVTPAVPRPEPPLQVPASRELKVTTRPRVPLPPPPPRVPAAAERPASSAQRQPAPVSTAAPAPAVASEYDIPEWSELSLEFRSGLSLPNIDVHVYDEDPARRFIMADLKKYREGETLANGAVLEKIHPDSIQLNYRGTRFRVDR